MRSRLRSGSDGPVVLMQDTETEVQVPFEGLEFVKPSSMVRPRLRVNA